MKSTYYFNTLYAVSSRYGQEHSQNWFRYIPLIILNNSICRSVSYFLGFSNFTGAIMQEYVVVEIKDRNRRKLWKTCLFDSGHSLEIPFELIIKHGLKAGTAIDAELFEMLRSGSEIARGKEHGLRLISYRARSEKELRQRIRQKGMNSAASESVIQDFKRMKLIDDEDFARRFVHDLICRKPAGEFLLRSELLKKGVNKEIIDKVMADTFSENDPVKLARSCMRQWLSRHPRTADKEKRSKIARFLFQRGFSRSVIEEIVGEESAF